MTELVKNGNFDNPALTNSQQYVVLADWGYSNVGYAKPPSSCVPTPLPSNFTQTVFFNTYYKGGTINQNITFPTSGDFILTFWTTLQPAPRRDLTQMCLVSIGSLNKTIYYNQTPNWTQYSVPFFVNSPSVKILTFLNPQDMLSDVGFLISGVSIVPKFNYTLDLYLEWIPDEEVEKNYKINRMIY